MDNVHIYFTQILRIPRFIRKPKHAEANKIICRDFASLGLSRINSSVSTRLTVQYFKWLHLYVCLYLSRDARTSAFVRTVICVAIDRL